MKTKMPSRENMLFLAKKAKRYCELLIEQSDHWLSEEEGARNRKKRSNKPREKKRKIR
ncbi:hypothetical protein M2480_002513 [Parabacteroides sp. PFB2-12]|uniref:hypothetical protein n=1 Tax=unclassified Parabacteroides TaxID=2649774 RepID=UPI002472EAC0|nr:MULTISPECIES: hypothetical protein [unclassified Parabacteroides]MDH6343812.1 hypothetical protein [Parabacteroides sp. PM6-13]MDH6391518.1 hypothetical protein [Parabacteroides sp. PFB2-12]